MNNPILRLLTKEVEAKLIELNARIEIIYPKAKYEKAVRNTLRSYAAKTIAPDLVFIERLEQGFISICLFLGALLSCAGIIIVTNMD